MKAFRILLALVWLMPLQALQAQIEERALLSVNIPFAFTVENTHLPAGHYLIYADFAVTMDQAQARPGRARLIFNRYNTEYVLHQIDNSAGRTTATLHVTKRERQLANGNARPDMAMVYAETRTQRE
ncbi:hypothetical protein H7849_18285 [Alloacidobacterium dinghuense]|uniref:Uncharacterized protein n=1 Tax=Alloacidobacterium dinghuense TaxID=2763107 RepID=A0A7G8BER9_9BACT|nr:hypothetical protein [Alloacidobacterium dinghuense]QNI31039.1 hypothetical protein H7849_18285 [Alloacidobacterium dinghuense]